MKMFTTSLAVVFFLLSPATFQSKALLGFESDCPTCLNGGLCLPEHRPGRIGQAHSRRCFCPSPWIGVACEIRANEDQQSFEGVASLHQIQPPVDAAEETVQTLEKDSDTSRASGKSEPLVDPPDVLVVSLLLEPVSDADFELIDEMAVRLNLYSAICPEDPCPLKIVLEDIVVLTWSPEELRLGVLFSAEEGSRSIAIQKALTAQLRNRRSALRSEALANHLRQYHFSFVPGDHDLSHLYRSDRNISVAGESSAAPGWPIGQSGVRMTKESSTPSVATLCISAIVIIKFWVTVASIVLERGNRWWYSSDQKEEHQDRFDIDFEIIFNLCDMFKLPIYPLANFAIFLYLLSARADQLTHGFGKPPKWVEDCMIASVVGFLLIVFWMALQFDPSRLRKHSPGDHSGFTKQQHTSWVVPLVLAQVAKTVCVAALIYGYYTMTPKDCQPGTLEIDAAIWQDAPTQDVPLEHQVCMWLFIQTYLSLKIEEVCANMWMWKLWLYPDDNELKKRIGDGMKRCRFIVKSSSFSPVAGIVILAAWHVIPQTDGDKAFREICLHSLHGFLLAYRFISIGAMIMPKQWRIDAGSMAHVVSYTSNVDYMTNHLGVLRDVMYINLRRSLLVVIYCLSVSLGTSVFFLNSDEGGPSQVVPEPVLWTILLAFQSIFVSFLLLAHETIIEPALRNNDGFGYNQHLLNSIIREVDCFTQLIPCLALLFLIAHNYALATQLPEWVVSSMNIIAQLMLLQLVLVLSEAVLGHMPEEEEADADTDPFLRRRELVEADLDQTRDVGTPGHKSLAAEAASLGRRVATMFFSCLQLLFLACLCISTQVLLIAVLTLKFDDHRNRDSILSVFPVSEHASAAIHVTVYCVLMYFVVKTIAHFTNSLRRMYNKTSWFAVSSMHKTEEFIDLTPWVIALCLLVQARAASFHGIHAAAPHFVTAHMYAIVISVLVEFLCNLLAASVGSPGKTGVLSDGLRSACLFVEVVASLVLHWGAFVLICSIPLMTAENVVLPDGSNGMPWRGHGEPPKLQYVVQNLLVLASIALLMTLFHKISHTMLNHTRQGKRTDKKSQLRLWIELQHGQVARMYRASSLARKAILDDSLQLALFFFPLASLKHPMMGDNRHHSQQEKMIPVMHMLFFVIGVALLMKTFFVFAFGYVDQPQKQEIMQASPRQPEEDEEHIMVFERSKSLAWSSEESSVLPIVQVFKRMALTVEICELFLFTALACMLIAAMHINEYSIPVLGKEMVYSSMVLFGIYAGTEYAWECAVLLGYPAGRLDALLDVVGSCPIVLLLMVAVRERTLEVAGRFASTPVVMLRLFVTATACVTLEFLVVLLASPRKHSKQLSEKLEAGVAYSQDRFEQTLEASRGSNGKTDKVRTSYIACRVALRLIFHCVICNILFALLWMTHDMCPQRV